MILRRIADGIRRQDWFVVVLEIFIVVFGVFIGIQVSNWNDARLDDGRARAYLERIVADLDADLAALEDREKFWRAVSRYGAKGLRYAQTGGAGGASKWELLLAYFQASQVAEFITLQATYDELKSAGDLGLIPDIEIRDALAKYYNFTGSATVVERPAYRVHVRGVIPMEIQAYIWDSCYESDQFGNQKMFDCASPVDEERAGEIVEVLANDAALMDELRYWMSTMHVALLIARDRAANATALKQMITAGLTGQPNGGNS